jgi:hypothetical protein
MTYASSELALLCWLLMMMVVFLLSASDAGAAETHRITVRSDIGGWQGPVCWAEAGQPLHVQAQGRWTIQAGERPTVGPGGYEKKRKKFPLGALVMQVGCHTDNLSNKDEPRRDPVVVERHAVEGNLRVVPEHGGLVYFYINDGRTGDNAGQLHAQVTGGQTAPVIGLGSPLLEDWPASISDLKAPWGEFQGQHIVLTLPTESMRKVDDPGKLMEFWDGIYRSYCELAGRAPAKAKTRYVPDVDISHGFMHAGNPIMYKMSTIPKLIDMQHPGFPNWGFLHELGHNFQQSVYTFGGTGEVTCNIFTLYGFHSIEREDMVEKKWRKGAEKKPHYLEEGADFNGTWKRTPFLALHTYHELIREFGWEAIKEMFRGYNSLPRQSRPRSDADKRDTFVVLMSRAVNRDLTPYFKVWGLPFSDSAARAVRGLKPWYGNEGREAYEEVKKREQRKQQQSASIVDKLRRQENLIAVKPSRWKTDYRMNYHWVEKPLRKSLRARRGQMDIRCTQGQCLRATHPLRIEGDFALFVRGVYFDKKGGHPYYRDAGHVALTPRGDVNKDMRVAIPRRGSTPEKGRPFALTLVRAGGRVSAEVNGKEAIVEYRQCSEDFQGYVAVMLGAGDRLLVQRMGLFVNGGS